jgi:integrase
MRHSLSSSIVPSLRIAPPQGRTVYWDSRVRGFGLRVTETGHKSWLVLYRRNGRLRWHTIGTYPPLSLADARKKARDALADVQKGKDPATEKRESRDADSFAVLAERYLNEWAKRHKKASSAREDERNIKRDLLPAWGTRKAGDITRRDVDELLEGIVGRGAAIHANRMHALVSKVYNFGIDKQIVEHNPAHKLKKPSQERQRDRVLDDHEIRAIGTVLDTEPPVFRALFRLLLLTGQRRSEIRNMRWTELDLESGWWTIPGERTKNGTTHRVPIVGEAYQILKPLDSGSSEYVFPGRTVRKPISSPQKSLARITQKSGVSFRVHDLRRTVGTNLARLGVDRTVIKKVLNHSEKGDVTAIYDRHSYDDQKRDALSRWDRRLTEVITGRRESAKVV